MLRKRIPHPLTSCYVGIWGKFFKFSFKRGSFYEKFNFKFYSISSSCSFTEDRRKRHTALPSPSSGHRPPRTFFPQGLPVCLDGFLESQRLWEKDCKEQAAHLPLHPLPPATTTAISHEVAPHMDGRAGNSNPLSPIRAGTHPLHPP